MNELIKAIRTNNLNYDTEADAYYTSDENTLVQFQDRESYEVDLSNNRATKVSSLTWARIWIDGKFVFNTSLPKYEARQAVIKFLTAEGVNV